MNSSVDLVAADALMRHGRFVRALARSLLADEHAAEDVAQEAWLRYLERPPRSALDPRGWFAAVVRHLASNARRDRDRRSEREATAALPASPASEGDDLAQAEVLRTVVEAVLALDEPYRSVVLARYFRGWEPKRIADETQVPIATVKSRLQRALAMLRERLDREHGGREAWGFALASLVDLGRVATSTMAWKVVLAAAVVAIPTIVVWRAWGTRTVTPVLGDAARTEASGPSAPEVPVTVEESAPNPGRTSASPTPGSRIYRVSGTVQNLPYPDLGLPGGPAAGVKVVAFLPREATSQPPKGKVELVTGSDGSFDLSFEMRATGHVSLTLRVERDETWRAVQHLEHLDAAAGECRGLVLSRAANGLLSGVAVDETDRPVPGARLRPEPRFGASDLEATEFTTDADGKFSVPWRDRWGTIESVDPTWSVLMVTPIEANEEGGWKPTRVLLGKGASLRVRVVDTAGDGVHDVYVRLGLATGERCTLRHPSAEMSSFHWQWRTGQTDENGSVDFEGAWAGHQLELEVGGHKASSQGDGQILFEAQSGEGEPVVLAAGEARTLVARWRGDLRITGRTLRPDRTPFPDIPLEVRDLGKSPTESGEHLGIVNSDAGGRFEARFRSRSLQGPIRIFAREKRSGGSDRKMLAGLGYANSLPMSEGAVGTRTFELAEAVDGVLNADVILEPSLTITGHVRDPAGEIVTKFGYAHTMIRPMPAGAPLLGMYSDRDAYGFRFEKDGLFTLFGLQPGVYDLYVSEELNSFYSWSSFLHGFPGIAAGSQGVELRLPAHEEVRVRIRVHGEGIERETVLHGRLFPRDPNREKRRAESTTRVTGVASWPVGAVLGFTGIGGAATEDGNWAHGFDDTTEIAEHAFPPIGPGWYVFGVHPSASNGERRWFPQATEPRWYEPGEYTIDFDAVPTTTISGKILADATREHLGVQLVTEPGETVPLEPQPRFGNPSFVVETDATGNFLINHAPVGNFRLRAGNAAELAHGRFRSEIPLEIRAEGISGLEIRF